MAKYKVGSIYECSYNKDLNCGGEFKMLLKVTNVSYINPKIITSIIKKVEGKTSAYKVGDLCQFEIDSHFDEWTTLYLSNFKFKTLSRIINKDVVN